MDKEKALDKIKKCLALSKSANEHEAAQTLKHAQALMAKYELDERDVALAEIMQSPAERTVPFKTDDWHWSVMWMVAEVFGCRPLQRGNKAIFYGRGNRPDLAAYAFDVVYRQLTAARRKWLKEQCKARKPANRKYLANQYCEGWIHGARRNVIGFLLNETEQQLLDAYHDRHVHSVIRRRETQKPTELQRAGEDAMRGGYADGKDVRLHRPMDGAVEVKQIGARV